MIAAPKLLCTVVAVVMFAIAAFLGIWWPSPRFNLVAGGLFFWALGDLFA